MPDRVLCDEILESDRWLDLPSDTHRLVYVTLLLQADDYGNLEGGPRRLFRWMQRFTQIKTEVDSQKLMSDLQDGEMVMRYEIYGKEYWHITRFKNSRWYWRRTCPQSPYPDDVTNEEKQRPSEKRNKRVGNTLPTRREGVGVGVGELHLRTPVGGAFDKFWAEYPRKKSKGQAMKAWRQLPAEQHSDIMHGLRIAIVSEDWRRENGRYIPHPATWLNARGWEDEPTTAPERKFVV